MVMHSVSRCVAVTLLVTGLVCAATSGDIVADVRDAIGRDDFKLAESEVQAWRAKSGVTPDMVEAHSWLGRGALAAHRLDQAAAYASETRKLALQLLKRRPLDAEKHLP